MFLGQLGAVLSLFVAAVGSCLGVSAAGTSAAGAWAKDARTGKPLRFIYIVMVSAPMTQTVYGFLVMLQIVDKLGAGVASGITLLGIGLATGNPVMSGLRKDSLLKSMDLPSLRRASYS